MNYFAHIFLSYDYPSLMMGNLIADWMTSQMVRSLNADLQRGIEMHRFIDSYTDTHTGLKENTRLLHPYFRKYAPVVLDVYYDYLLSKNWQQFSEIPIDTFRKNCYQLLETQIANLNSPFKERVTGIIENQLFESYSDMSGVLRSIHFLSKRMSRPEIVQDPKQVLLSYESILEQNFIEFFHQICRETSAWRKNV